jgi:4'-phosphopantetheinyl transferase
MHTGTDTSSWIGPAETPAPGTAPSPAEVHLWAVRVKARSGWPDLLNPAEKEQAARFLVEHARATYVTSRATQQLVLGHYLRQAPGTIQVDRTCGHCEHPNHGRPSVNGPLDYSVSHTAHWVLIAVTGGGLTGVDIESGGSARDFGGLSRQILTPAELAHYSATDSASRVAWLLRAWARKEAAMKVSGLGMRATPSQLDVAGPVAEATAIPGWPAAPVHLYDLPSLEDHHAAVASTLPLTTFTRCTIADLA